MNLTFEINGYVINITETEEGMVSVSATKDDEVVEEFTLEGSEEGGEEDMEDFEEGGEDDFDAQSLPPQGQAQAQIPQGQAQAQLGESKLESFASFLKRK